MAGTDTPESKIAAGLVGDNTNQTNTPTQTETPDYSAYITPQGPPNANRPGAPTPPSDAQAGGPKAPPTDANADQTPAPTDNKTAAAPTDNKTAAAPTDNKTQTPANPTDAIAAGTQPTDNKTTTTPTDNQPQNTTVADAGDKSAPPKDAAGATPNALDVMHKVNDILDKDVPALNKAHDLDGAKKAYEKAIALAETLTAQDLQSAQQALVEVRKEKAAATDPTSQRDLANKEGDLYTITRLKDAALGNMALWYYRQGKTEDGNAKLLEAAGVDPNTAQQLKKMGPDESKQFFQMLLQAPALSPILGDNNFYKQINNINQAGGHVPEFFSKLHDAVLKHNQAAGDGSPTTSDNGAGTPGAKGPGTSGDSTAGAGSDHKAAPTGDGSDNIAPPYDAKQAKTDMSAFVDLQKQLGDKGGPLSADQRKVLEAGVKAFDNQTIYVGNVMDQCQKALNQVFPPEKQDAYAKAMQAVADDENKLAVKTDVVGQDGKKTQEMRVPDAVQKQVDAINTAKTPADFKTAVDALNKTSPQLVKDLQAAAAILPQGADGVKALDLYQQNQHIQQMYLKASMQQVLAHYSYSKELTQTKNPPDATDLNHAKEVFKAGFNNVPPAISENVLSSPEAQTLCKTLGIKGDAANVQGDGTGKPAAGTDNGGNPAATGADKPTGLAALSVPELQTQLDAAIKKGPAGMKDAKALFEEEIRRADDPDRKKTFTDALKAGVTALEQNKMPDGTALDADARMKIQAQNVECISALSTSAQLHSMYALYLGDNRLALDPKHKELDVANVDGGLNQLKSMDEQQKKAIAAADSIDPDLLHRADAQINADRKAGIGDRAGLDQLKIAMEGGKDDQHQSQLGLLNMRVTMRDQLAALYLMQGKQFRPDGSVMASVVPQSHSTDALFKPKEALQLLTDAQAANEKLNGKGATNLMTDQLMELGQKVNPDVFKAEADALKQSGASALSDVAAMGGSIVGSTVVKFAAVAIGEALTHGDLNPAVVNGISTAGAIGSGILTRRVAHQLITGKSESWSDSVVHGSAAALAPIIIKGTGALLAENKATAGALNYRAGNFTTESVLQRTATELGPDATFSQVAERFKASGLTSQARELAALGDKPVSAATADELANLNKAVNLNGARGREAMIKLFPTMEKSAANAKIAEALETRGVHTVGDLQDQLANQGSYIKSIADEVGVQRQALAEASELASAAKASGLKGVADDAPVTDVLKEVKVGGKGPDAGNLRFATPEAVQEQADKLARAGITKVGQLREASAIGDNAPIARVLKAMKNTDGSPILATQEDLDKELALLKENKITTAGELANAGKNAKSYFTVDKLYPDLAGAPADVSLKDAVREGVSFGEAGSAGHVQLKNIVPDANLGPNIKAAGFFGRMGGRLDGLGHAIKDGVYTNRVWAMTMDAPVVEFPNMPGKAASELVAGDAAPAATGGWKASIGRTVDKIKPEFNAPSFPNAGKLDPMYATQKQIGIASAQTKYWQTAVSSAAGLGYYNVQTGLYDNWWKGGQYQGSDGQYHQNSFMHALGQAAEVTVGESLVAGFLLKGEMPSVLEEAGAKPGVLSRISPRAAEAVNGSGASLKNYLKFSAFGMPTTWQGGLDLMNASDKNAAVKSNDTPLEDATPDDIGTGGDKASKHQQVAPQDKTTPAPQTPADSTQTTQPADTSKQQPAADQSAIDPNTDVSTPDAADSTKTQTKPPSTPSQPAATQPAAAKQPAAQPTGSDLDPEAPPGN